MLRDVTSTMISVSSLFRVCLLLSAGGIVGCGPGGPEIARVEGTITLDGKPLGRAFVVFIPPGGRPAAAETDANGKYVLDFGDGRMGTVPGVNRVEINTARQLEYAEDVTVIPGVKEMVPAKYNKMTTLEVNVESGKTNVADFELDSKGKIAVEAGAY